MTPREFDDAVSRGTVVVDFFAKWCGPCKVMGALLDELNFSENFVLLKIDIDTSNELAEKYHINRLPTVMVFKNGEMTDKFTDLQTKDVLRAAIK